MQYYTQIQHVQVTNLSSGYFLNILNERKLTVEIPSSGRKKYLSFYFSFKQKLHFYQKEFV